MKIFCTFMKTNFQADLKVDQPFLEYSRNIPIRPKYNYHLCHMYAISKPYLSHIYPNACIWHRYGIDIRKKWELFLKEGSYTTVVREFSENNRTSILKW